MKRLIIVIIYAILLNSCELIVIRSGKPATKEVNYDRSTAVGTVYLFKAELENDNVPAASRYLIGSESQKLLAIERYDLYPEVARFGKLLQNLPITAVRVDTLAQDTQKVSVELDYVRTITFVTLQRENYWYIYKLNGFYPK